MMFLVMTLMALGVVLAAVLAAYGFKGRVTAIGVDLGTSFSVVGVMKNGKVQIVTDDQERNIFPSVVSYLDNGKIERFYEAVALGGSNPENTIYNAKRFIGREIDEDVKKYAENHPFHVVFEKSSKYSHVGFNITSTGHGNQLISPERVGTDVLKGLLELTASFIGHNQVNKAVIAVPAKFSSEQRMATADAYKAAGLKVTRVIEEPTAAAIAYDLHKKDSVHHIIVYDFGGGTLDVSLLYVADGSIQVYATDGDDSLGGSDFDICLEHLIIDKLNMRDKSGRGLVDATLDSISTKMKMKLVLKVSKCRALRSIAEQIKKNLSKYTVVELQCDSVEHEAYEHQGTKKHVTISISRLEFEQEYTPCTDLFDRSLAPLARLLEDLEMSPQDVDEVVLVGGSTRVPHVKKLLRDFFDNKVNVNDRIDPDVTVAYGAASIID